ncbi:MAG: DUF2490 domain-containing protein [Cytophagales bacterium]|nr:DUF2490 domain-containing protein [Cytophaga sp.]
MKTFCIHCLLLLLLSNKSGAQNLTFYGFLPVLSQTGRISDKIDYNTFLSTTIDAFARTEYGTEYPPKDLQLYIQPSLIYKFGPNVNVAASYTYQRNNPLSDDYSNEHRIWEQCILSRNFSKVRMTNRFRLEERFIQNRAKEYYPFSTRLRYQLGFNLPLQGKTLDAKEFYLNTYNEFYFSLTGVKNATYSENWTYAGIGYTTGAMGRVELGYLLQMAVRDKQHDLRILNLMQISWITNITFKKKQD